MQLNELKRVKELEKEIYRLKRIYADYAWSMTSSSMF
jgi:hypothetical protein